MAAIRSAEPYVRSILRLMVGFLLSLHGLQKLLGLFGGMGGSGGRAPFASLMWVAGGLEMVGGLLILVGLFTAPVAFILSGEMAVAYFMMHFPHGILPIRNGGELAALYCFVYLYFSVAGPGPLSVDALVRKGTG
jgi:putative oxidoreductase